MIFLDTNIVLYAIGYNGENEKSEAARAVMRGTSVSVQVLAELSSLLSRRRNRAGAVTRSWAEIDDIIHTLDAIFHMIVPLDQNDQRRARRIADTGRLSYYDAQIIAVAVRAGGTVLLSEDMNHGQIIDGMEIRNPFL